MTATEAIIALERLRAQKAREVREYRELVASLQAAIPTLPRGGPPRGSFVEEDLVALDRALAALRRDPNQGGAP